MRAGKRLDHRKGLNGFAEAHLVGKKASQFAAGEREQPERAVHLIMTQAFAERPEGFGRQWCGRRLRPAHPGGNACLDIGPLHFPDAIRAPFLRGIAIAQNFFEIGGEGGVGHRDFPSGQAEARRPALEKFLNVLRGEDGLAPRRKMDVKVEPSVAFLAEGKLGFEADDIACHMLESFAFAECPARFQARHLRCKKPYDGILPAQGGFATDVFKPAADQLAQGFGLGGGIGNAGLRVVEADVGFEVVERSFE